LDKVSPAILKFPRPKTKADLEWERELAMADELFRDWKDLGCPENHPGALLYE
jgi:hypothetical protein